MSNRHEEELMRLRDAVARLESANDTLVARIEDLTEGYALEDTCPRVQCRATSRRLKNQVYELQPVVDALHRIASMPLEPRPDGTYNYCRNALVQIAQDAIREVRILDTNDATTEELYP